MFCFMIFSPFRVNFQKSPAVSSPPTTLLYILYIYRSSSCLLLGSRVFCTAALAALNSFERAGALSISLSALHMLSQPHYTASSFKRVFRSARANRRHNGRGFRRFDPPARVHLFLSTPLRFLVYFIFLLKKGAPAPIVLVSYVSGRMFFL